jgi:hypothetical protein
MTQNNADRQVCIWTYQVRPEAEARFLDLLRKHWPTLHRLGFVTDAPPLVFRSSEEPLTYVEISTWEAEGMRPAHDHPDVIAIWERFKPLVEERRVEHDVAGMSFPFYGLVELSA